MSEFVDAKKLLESTGHLVVEKQSKKTFDTFLTYLMNQDGRCSADGGDHTFYCLKLNDKNFDFEGYDKFREQIEKEGLYDWAWVAGLIPNDKLDQQGRVSVSWLPIFGDSNRYVTKWLQNGSPSSAVNEIFRDRRMKVKDRIDYFAIPAEEQLSLNALKEELEKIGLACRIGNNYRKGDFLETNIEFTKEECEKMRDIPVSSGYKIVWLIRNKFVINKHKFSSVEKVVQYFNDQIDLNKMNEAFETIENSGKKLIKENKHLEKASRDIVALIITQELYDSITDLNYEDASNYGEYFSDLIADKKLGSRLDIAEDLEYKLDEECGILIKYDLALELADKIIEMAG